MSRRFKEDPPAADAPAADAPAADAPAVGDAAAADKPILMEGWLRLSLKTPNIVGRYPSIMSEK